MKKIIFMLALMTIGLIGTAKADSIVNFNTYFDAINTNDPSLLQTNHTYNYVNADRWTFDNWKARLTDITKTAETVYMSRDIGGILDIEDRLNNFIERSKFICGSSCDKLRTIARALQHALNESALDLSGSKYRRSKPN